MSEWPLCKSTSYTFQLCGHASEMVLNGLFCALPRFGK